MSARLCYCGHSTAPLGPGSDGAHSEDDNSCMACAVEHNRSPIAPCLDDYELPRVVWFDTSPACHESYRPPAGESLSGRVMFP